MINLIFERMQYLSVCLQSYKHKNSLKMQRQSCMTQRLQKQKNESQGLSRLAVVTKNWEMLADNLQVISIPLQLVESAKNRLLLVLFHSRTIFSFFIASHRIRGYTSIISHSMTATMTKPTTGTRLQMRGWLPHLLVQCHNFIQTYGYLLLEI